MRPLRHRQLPVPSENCYPLPRTANDLREQLAHRGEFRFGLELTGLNQANARQMSPPIADELVQRRERSKSANSGLMHRSEHALFDHVIGSGE